MPRNAGYALYINYKMLVMSLQEHEYLYKMQNEMDRRRRGPKREDYKYDINKCERNRKMDEREIVVKNHF
jgi:hypothetical protein